MLGLGVIKENPVAILYSTMTRTLIILWLLCLVTSPYCVAQDLSELGRLAREHASPEVREAILQCTTGKFETAIPVLKKFATDKDVGAAYVLANMHVGGIGVEKSIAKAEEFLRANISADHIPSMLLLGQLKSADAPAEALQLFKQAAAKKDPLALVRMGNIYEAGQLGARANPRLAVSMFEKAQSAGHPLGDYHMARCYDSGISVSPDALRATRLYRKAGKARIVAAQIAMAKRYEEGIGVEADSIAAFGWLTMASQSGSTEAMVIAADLNLAGQLYSKAAQKGDPAGRYQLALLYLEGKGTPPDPVRAYVLLENIQTLTKAKKTFDELVKEMTPEQIELAKQKIAEGKGK